MKNLYLITAFNFSWMFIPVLAIFVPFTTSLGLNMTDFFLLQSFFNLIVILIEVPSGYAADILGRKNTMTIGALFGGVGFSLLSFSTQIWHLYVYEAFIALSLSFISGSDYALLFDSLKKLKPTNQRKLQARWTSNFMIASFLGEALSSALGGVLALFSLSHVVTATSLAGWFPLLISFFIKEVDYKKMDSKKHKENFRTIVFHLFKDSLFLRLLFINFVVWSLSTMCAVWLIQKSWQEQNLALGYYGFLWAGFALIGALSNHFSHAFESKVGPSNALIASAVCVLLAYFLSPLFSLPVSLAFVSLFYISRGFFQPIFKEAFNHRIKEDFRATANSIYSLVFRLSFMVTGPLIGLYVDKFKVNAGFYLLGLCFSILFLLALLPFVRLIKKEAS